MKSEGKLESVHKEGYLQKEGTDGIIKSNQYLLFVNILLYEPLPIYPQTS